MWDSDPLDGVSLGRDIFVEDTRKEEEPSRAGRRGLVVFRGSIAAIKASIESPPGEERNIWLRKFGKRKKDGAFQELYHVLS